MLKTIARRGALVAGFAYDMLRVFWPIVTLAYVAGMAAGFVLAAAPVAP